MKKVLILESNEAFAKELSEYFEREGYAVCGVSGDGAEGLSLLEKNAPNVVVTSLLLTGVDGFTVMERAKKEGIKADFIVLGNFADDKIINRAIALGARYYLMKPVSAHQRIQLSARRYQDGCCRSQYHQQCDKGTLSRHRGKVCNHCEQG